MPDLARRIAVARGDEPADVVVRGGRVLCVFTREWLEADVAVVDGYVAGLGHYEGKEVVDASGRWVVPGFVDAHMHLESTKLLVDEWGFSVEDAFIFLSVACDAGIAQACKPAPGFGTIARFSIPKLDATPVPFRA